LWQLALESELLAEFHACLLLMSLPMEVKMEDVLSFGHIEQFPALIVQTQSVSQN
jgi:hypothetical protein